MSLYQTILNAKYNKTTVFVYMHSNQTNLSCGYNKSSKNDMHY